MTKFIKVMYFIIFSRLILWIPKYTGLREIRVWDAYPLPYFQVSFKLLENVVKKLRCVKPFLRNPAPVNKEKVSVIKFGKPHFFLGYMILCCDGPATCRLNSKAKEMSYFWKRKV